jgi:hypothetical protein
VDHHRHSARPLAAGFFWWEHQPKVPAHRKLDSHPDRYRGHPRHFEIFRDRLIQSTLVIRPENKSCNYAIPSNLRGILDSALLEYLLKVAVTEN